MPANQLFNIHQIVWAKVQPYPWWPAKIIKTLQQSKQTLYKILFFADKTYSYLDAKHLQNFDTFNPPPFHSYVTPETQKSLQLAIKAVKQYRNKVIKLKKSKQTEETSENSPIQVEQSSKKQQKMEENLDSFKSNQQQQKEGVKLCGQIRLECISTVNVIEMIEASRRCQKKLNYCYQKRKEQINIIEELKQKLLMKYNLLNYDRKNRQQNQDKRVERRYKPICKKIIVNKYKNKRQVQVDMEILKNKCANKIKKLLISSSSSSISSPSLSCSQSCSTQSSSISIHNNSSSSSSSLQNDYEYIRRQSKNLIRRISFLSDNSKIKFYSLMVTLIKSIGRVSGQARCQQKLIQFKHYLQKLQHQKQQDEEGSKLTQIQNN